MGVSKALVMSLYATTSDYDVVLCGVVVGQMRLVLPGSRGMGAVRFFLAGDFFLELTGVFVCPFICEKQGSLMCLVMEKSWWGMDMMEECGCCVCTMAEL